MGATENSDRETPYPALCLDLARTQIDKGQVKRRAGLPDGLQPATSSDRLSARNESLCMPNFLSPLAQEDPKVAFQSLIDNGVVRPMRTAVVHPVDGVSLEAVVGAVRARQIEPILVGPSGRIRAAAEASRIDLSGFRLVDVPHSHAAADKAVALARSGEVDALMKGNIHTNELMAACVADQTGLRTDRRMSHVFVLETPAYSKWLLISDGALNIAPNLDAKRWIVQNAIDLAQSIGITLPLVAILSATEEVDTNIPSTIDAAALCKMADREQIRGGLVDGPMAFDLAISNDAVRAKGLVSKVAGHADILIVPGIEAGNMLAKQLDYLAGAAAAGIVLGAQVPIILNSRSDSANERIASCALARHYLAWKDVVS